MKKLFNWPTCSRDPKDDIQWLQELVDILAHDLYNRDGEQVVGSKVEFSGCCYLDHTMGRVQKHIQEYVQEVKDAQKKIGSSKDKLKVGDVIDCWWPCGQDGKIERTYIVSTRPEVGFYLGNTDGYDDWGYVILPVEHPPAPGDNFAEDWHGFDWIAAYRY